MNMAVKLLRDNVTGWNLPVTPDCIECLAMYSVDDEQVTNHEWVKGLATELTPDGFDMYVDAVARRHEAS